MNNYGCTKISTKELNYCVSKNFENLEEFSYCILLIQSLVSYLENTLNEMSKKGRGKQFYKKNSKML